MNTPEQVPSSPGATDYVRLSIRIPRSLVQRLKAAVESGAARSVSAFVTAAVEGKLEREAAPQAAEGKLGHDDLPALLEEMRQETGPPTPEEQAWVDEILDHVREGRPRE